MLKIRHILVPTDFSEHAERSAAYAGEMARVFGARVTVLHVAEPAFDYRGYGLRPETIQQIQDELVSKRDDKLAAVCRAVGDGVETTPVAVEGPAAPEITGYAEAHDADLIVIATRGIGGVRHALFGSTAERVVRSAACPVVTLRPE